MSLFEKKNMLIHHFLAIDILLRRVLAFISHEPSHAALMWRKSGFPLSFERLI